MMLSSVFKKAFYIYFVMKTVGITHLSQVFLDISEALDRVTQAALHSNAAISKLVGYSTLCLNL